MMRYSAGFTKEKWSEHDIEAVINLLQKYDGKKQILDEAVEKNLFQLRSPLSIKNRFNMVYNRARTLNPEMQKMYLTANDYDRKVLVLYTFMRAYRIPLEFYQEILIYKYQQQEPLYKNDFHYFFAAKAEVNETVASWRPETIKRLISALTLFFREAKMIEKIDDTKFDVKPIHATQSLKTYAERNCPLIYSFTVLEKVNEHEINL